MGNVFGFFRAGGFIMWPLLACSLVLVTMVIERAWTLRKLAVDGDSLLDEVKELVGDRRTQVVGDAVALCERAGGSVGRMFARGLRNANRPADAIEMAMEQEAANEQPSLEANLPIIKTIVNISPLLGLLGTIAGMIAAFRAASQTGLSSPTQILGGISEALISTATGITLAVLGFIFYNYFGNLVKKILEDMEYYGSELVNFLTDRVS